MDEKKFLSLKEIQREETLILKDVKEILEKNNLKWSIIGGTQLGAIRHQGFIPWDDDIDICMPREDYDKFIKIFQKENTNKNLEITTIELNNSFLPFSKILNKKIEIKDGSVCDQKKRYLWIDVFPLDSLPENKLIAKVKIKIIEILKKVIYIREYKTDYKKGNLGKNIIRSIIRPFSFLISGKTIIKMAKSKNNNTKYVLNLVWGYPHEKILREDSEKYVKTKFEDIEVNGLKEYDTYLKIVYGDYMKLPPVEKRRNHKIKAWRV